MTSRTGIRARSLRSEAQRNLTSGTTHAMLFGVVWFVVVSGLLLWNLAVTAELDTSAQRYRDAGASVTVVEAAGRIDGHRCAEMAKLPNVRHAGALRVAERQLVPSVTPGVEIPTYDATPDFVRIVNEKVRDSNGVFLSTTVADALGEGRTTIDLGSESVAIAGTFSYPEDGRRPVLGYAALQTVPAQGDFDQCWVDVWPESSRIQSLASSSVVVGEDAGQGPPTVGQLNPSLGTRFDGEEHYRDRATALLPEALVLLGASLGFVAVRIRRLELAAARLVGIRPVDQCYQLLMESGAWVFAASIGSLAATAATTAAVTPDLLRPIIEFAILAGVAGIISVLCGVLLGITSINSRRALAYFRDR